MEPNITTTRSRSVLIEAEPDAVYEFVTTPGNWPRCHPGSKAITGQDESAPVGTSFIEHAHSRTTCRSWTSSGSSRKPIDRPVGR